MKVIRHTSENDLAMVYIASTDEGQMIEFVESVTPPYPREEKWVLIVSTLFGCPVDCKFCDAGGRYGGKLSVEEIFFQIDYLIDKRFPTRKVQTNKFKIQFARVGEPAFNPNVLEVLEQLPDRYQLRGFIPSLSTIAPRSTSTFFDRLLELKNRLYQESFQLQFSLHSTDQEYRDFLMPVEKWDLPQIAAYGNRFYNEGNRKITLNFALSKGSIVDPEVMIRYFNPDVFLVKITPVNPTFKALENGLESTIEPDFREDPIINQLRAKGYDVILSIGELEENRIGSNCGQYLQALNRRTGPDAYTYEIVDA